jgi:hypothetical protein
MHGIGHNVQSMHGGDEVEEVDTPAVRLEVNRIGLGKEPLFLEHRRRAVHMRSRR